MLTVLCLLVYLLGILVVAWVFSLNFVYCWFYLLGLYYLCFACVDFVEFVIFVWFVDYFVLLLWLFLCSLVWWLLVDSFWWVGYLCCIVLMVCICYHLVGCLVCIRLWFVIFCWCLLFCLTGFAACCFTVHLFVWLLVVSVCLHTQETCFCGGSTFFGFDICNVYAFLRMFGEYFGVRWF